MQSSDFRMHQTFFPYVLSFRNIKFYVTVILFVFLDTAIPWFCHMIHPLAGPVFLPMFFFVMLSGLLFGWKTGLCVGFLTPLVSYTLSGMPFPAILPRIIVEASLYGFISGFFRERFNLSTLWSIVFALIFGRIAAVLELLIVQGSITASLSGIWQAAKIGWPGIVLQIILLPLVLKKLEQLLASRHEKS